MHRSARAIVWDGSEYPDSLSYRDFELATPEPGWVLFATKAAGICGTDVHLLLGDTRHLIPDRNLPAVLGRENAGVVVEVGEGVTSVQPGDRVAVEPTHGCAEFGGSCAMCRSGRYQLCQAGLAYVGMPLTRMIPGGFGEYSVAHASRLFRIPDHVSFEEAALLDTLAVTVHALNVGHPRVGMSAAVVGCGVVGLDQIQCLRVAGVRNIVAVAKYPFQAELASELGAGEVVLLDEGIDPVAEVMHMTGGWGVDQVYECVGGHTDAVAQSVAMCAYGGVVVMLGGSARPCPIDLQDMLLKEVHILSSNSYSTHAGKREFEVALDMVCDGRVDHERLVTHMFTPDAYRQAFEVAIHKGEYQAIKPMFVRP